MNSPPRWAAATLALMAACTQSGGPSRNASPETIQKVTITAPANSSELDGNVLTLNVQADGIDIVRADGDASGKTGHYHVFIDLEPAAPGEIIEKSAGIVHSTDEVIEITGLGVGEHRFVLVLGDGNHRRIGAAADEVTLIVNGPSVIATAPATVRAGKSFEITVDPREVEIVPADGDTSGNTGHLHVLIDPAVEPTAGGNPIPKRAGIIHSTETTIEIPPLAEGEHTLWVVLGDGNHVPFSPLVAHKLFVTVS